MNIRRTALFALAWLPGLATPARSQVAEPGGRPQSLAITGVTLIDGTGAPARPGMTVIVADGHVAAVSPDRGAVLPRGLRRIDGRGKYLIPGLWDMHVHLAARAITRRPDGKPDFTTGADFFFPYFLASGVTGVRDMAGQLPVLAEWRREVAAGSRAGPRMVITGRKIGEHEPVVPGGPREPKSRAAVRQSLELLRAGGADFAKLEMLPDTLYPALMEEAARVGLPVAGHVPPNLGAGRASDLGFRSLEHLMDVMPSASTDSASLRAGPGRLRRWWDRWRLRLHLVREPALRAMVARHTLDTQDDSAAAALFRRFAANHTWIDPTLLANRDVKQLRPDTGLAATTAELLPNALKRKETTWWAEEPALAARASARELALVGMMHRMGVPLLAGTDMPGLYRLPGESLVEELELFVEAGLTPAEVLRIATHAPAEFLGALDTMGTVEPGKVADLVLLDADPLERIGNLRRVAGVVAAGRYWPRTGLDSMVAVADSLKRAWDAAR